LGWEWGDWAIDRFAPLQACKLQTHPAPKLKPPQPKPNQTTPDPSHPLTKPNPWCIKQVAAEVAEAPESFTQWVREELPLLPRD